MNIRRELSDWHPVIGVGLLELPAFADILHVHSGAGHARWFAHAALYGPPFE